MKRSAIIALVFLCPTVLGQDYLGYYEQVNEAKLHAADSNFLQSALLFQKAFETYDFEFARDCINAVEVSAALSQDTLVAYFVRRALISGVPISLFEEKPELATF
ncbi:MAG: hypothetical protein AAFQ98_24605, partial [Bacteroidota bacterium]